MSPQPGKLMPALYGGIIMALVSAIPILNFVNCFCCAGIMFGGLMAVFFYKKDLTPDKPPLSSSDALQLGALAGVFGAIIGSLLTAALLSIMGNVTGDMLVNFLEKYREEFPPGTFDQMQEKLMHGGLSMLNLFFSLILDTLFGLLGGLIGYAIFKPKRTTMNVQPPSMPPAQRI
jgi:ABC-type phosphate transport system permease subunit